MENVLDISPTFTYILWKNVLGKFILAKEVALLLRHEDTTEAKLFIYHKQHFSHSYRENCSHITVISNLRYPFKNSHFLFA